MYLIYRLSKAQAVQVINHVLYLSLKHVGCQLNYCRGFDNTQRAASAIVTSLRVTHEPGLQNEPMTPDKNVSIATALTLIVLYYWLWTAICADHLMSETRSKVADGSDLSTTKANYLNAVYCVPAKLMS